jgi:hypothetical protein
MIYEQEGMCELPSRIPNNLRRDSALKGVEHDVLLFRCGLYIVTSKTYTI